MTRHYDDMKNILEKRECKIIKITNKSEPMQYICMCGSKKKQLYKDFLYYRCPDCNDLKKFLGEKIKVNDHINTHYDDMKFALEKRGCKIVKITIKSEPMHYICSCGEEKKQLYRHFIKNNSKCKDCTNQKLDVEVLLALLKI